MNTKEQNHPTVLDRITSSTDQHMRELAGQLGETVTRTGEGLEESFNNIEMKFDDAGTSLIDKTKEYARTTHSYVTKNPWAAVGISAGLAFLAGMLIGRKRDN